MFIERFSTECRKTKTKVIATANKKKENIRRSESKLKVNTRNRPQARENASDQVAIGFSFASDWPTERVVRVF